jgi:hypothetical protein
VEDTWGSRYYPVLEATVRLVDAKAPEWVRVSEIAIEAGLDEADVVRALTALRPLFVGEIAEYAGGGVGQWTIDSVTSEARQLVGEWPSPRSLIDQLAEAFKAAADREPDAQERGRLREIASALTGGLRDLAVEVAAEILGRRFPAR